MAGNVTGSVNLAVKSISNVDQSVIFNRIVTGIQKVCTDSGYVYSLAIAGIFALNLPNNVIGLYVRNLDPSNTIILGNATGYAITLPITPGGVFLQFDGGALIGVSDFQIQTTTATIEYAWWAA